MKILKKIFTINDDKISDIGSHIVSILVDTIFLILWFYLQVLIKIVLKIDWLSNIDIALYHIFQFIFSISTLLPVLIYIYKDIMMIWISACKKINNEKINE